jgi:hypothetical protein
MLLTSFNQLKVILRRSSTFANCVISVTGLSLPHGIEQRSLIALMIRNHE